MPRPTSSHDQREAVRMLAMVVGVREAARQSGLDENRVMQWSKRYQWLAKTMPKVGKNTLSANVSKAADNLAKTLQTDKRQTIHALSRATRRHAEHLAKQRPSLDVKRSVMARNWASVADTVHGISAANEKQGNLSVNILSQGRAIVQIAPNATTNEPRQLPSGQDEPQL